MPCAADCTAAPLIRLAGAVHRITDCRGESGTADLVVNLREQARLEQLIDGVKPPVPSDWPEAEDERPLPSHRLLLTPFRYPPLESGSRFGRAHQRHLFYGARALETALAERAFHALRPIEDSPRSPHTPPVVGVMTPYAFSSTPMDLQDWTLEITAQGVTAVCFGGGLTAHFSREQFLVAGRWSQPT